MATFSGNTTASTTPSTSDPQCCPVTNTLFTTRAVVGIDDGPWGLGHMDLLRMYVDSNDRCDSVKVFNTKCPPGPDFWWTENQGHPPGVP